MKKALILGGSHRDIPLIEQLKKEGCFVITLGAMDYYIGHKFADRFYKIDFNNLNEIRNVIRKEKIDYLIAGCGEESYKNTAFLANETGLGVYDDEETVEIIHNKLKFKEFCLKNSIPVPKGGFDYKNLSFPIIIKPQNLSGGRGVVVVKNERELQQALNYSKNYSEKILFEEFIQGEIIAYSVIIKSQKVLYDFVAKDEPYLNPYLISTAYTYEIDENIRKDLKKSVEKIAEKLNLKNGPFHLQVLIKNNDYYIMDVTRRIAGDLFPYLIEYGDNVNYMQMVVNSYIGRDFNLIKGVKKYALRHCVMPEKNGIYEGVECKIDYNLRLDLLKKGEMIKDNIRTHTNIFISVFDDYESLLNTIKHINSLIYAKIKD